MEKIYTQQQGQKNKKRNGMNFSVILSFAVAIFALFSVAMFGVFGTRGSNVSYAAPTGESFVAKVPEVGTEAVTAVMGITDNNEYFNVPLYYADSINPNNRVFCVELRKEFEDNKQYSKAANDNLANDPGLMYILNNTYANGVKKFDPNSAAGDYSEYLELWGTQAAIWLYLSEKYPNEAVYKFPEAGERSYKPDPADETGYPLDTVTALKNTKKFQLVGGPETMNTIVTNPAVAATVQSLVAEAMTKKTMDDNITLSIKPASDEMSTDGKYYQTALVSVTGTPANSLKSYSITSITGLEGVKVVDENGKDLPLTNITAGKKFYLRIPINKLSNKATTLKVGIDANFNIKTGVFYTSGSNQKVVSLTDTPKTVSGGIDFEITGSTDTGMNAAQTIYFIGLIVLLCGVGIVYANAKPVESKQ